MGAEIGATTSLFAYDAAAARYLKSTGREDYVDAGRGRGRRPPGRRRGPGRPRPATSTRSSRSTSTSCGPSSTAPTPPTGPAPSTRWAPRPRPRAGPRRSATRWSARAPTPPTRTSPGPRRIARHAADNGLRTKTDLMITPGSEQVRATIERDGLLADFDAHRGHRAGQRLRAVHRPVGPLRRVRGRREHDRHLVQPQLPQAQRRPGQHAGLRHLARDRRRPGPGRHRRLRPADRHADQRRRRGGPPGRARRRGAAGRRASTPGESGFIEPPADGSERRGRGPARLRPAPAARAVRRRGTARTTSSCRSW